MKKKSLLSVIPQAILFGVIIACITFLASDKLGITNYKAQAKILTTSKENITDHKDVAVAYAATVDSDAIKNKVLTNLGLDRSPADLDKKLTIVPVENSPVINFVIEDSIKLRAEDLADEYADVSVAVLNNLYDTDTQVLEYSYQSAGRKSTKEKNAAIFGGAAFVIWLFFGMIFTAISNSRMERLERKEVENKKQAKEVKQAKPVKEERKAKKKEDLSQTNKYKVVSEIPKQKDGDSDAY
jgi:capsular polysaccharide biosynthesis protein